MLLRLAAARYDFFNRNGMDTNGFLNMPAVGMNYFFKNCNLKLQAMYQYIARKGHDTQLDRDNDDLGLAVHSASILLVILTALPRLKTIPVRRNFLS